jgi:hypothetical protein
MMEHVADGLATRDPDYVPHGEHSDGFGRSPSIIFNIAGVRAGCDAESGTVNIAFDILGISLGWTTR